MRILIVDDDAGFLMFVTVLLREAGFDVETASCGKDAIIKSLALLPDLMLIDYHLGDMTGEEVAVGVKCMRKTAGIPFLVLSSLGGDPMLINGFKKFQNCKGTLVKTGPAEEILKAVKTVLLPGSDPLRERK